MVYAPEMFNTNLNLTDPFAPTANPNDFGDGTNKFVELFNLARKQEQDQDKSEVKALKKPVQSDHVVKMTPAGWASSLPDSEFSKPSP